MSDASAAERSLADRRMREINEAWRVLGDPTSRRRYDDSRLAGRRPSAGAARGPSGAVARSDEDDDDLVEVLPPMTAVKAGVLRHFPWVVLLAIFAVIFVFSAYATTRRDEPASTPTVEVGTCLDTGAATSTTIVTCDGPHDLEVVDRQLDPKDCPKGTEARRLGRDAAFDCVRKG